MAARTYRDLVAWKRAIDLVVKVYAITRGFPREEVYGLTSQIRRAAVSIASNIAEGQGRGVGNEFTRYLRISQGSLQELETQLMIAERLGYLDAVTLTATLEKADEVGRLLRGLHKAVAKSNN
jgi:four helix bundle protein